MPSIRRSLIAYFLLLLAVALGAVGLLVDRFASEAVRGQEDADAKRFNREYEVSCQRVEREFNDDLERKAEALGKELRWKLGEQTVRDRERVVEQPLVHEPEEWEKRYRLAVAGLQFAGLGSHPLANLTGQYTVANTWTRTPIFWMFQRAHSDELVRLAFAEDAKQHQHPPYFQFNYPRSRRTIRGPGTPELPPVPVEELTQVFTVHKDVPTEVGMIRLVIHRVPLRGDNIFRGPGRPNLSRILALQSAVGVASTATGPLPPQPLPAFLLDRNAELIQYVYVQCGRPKADLERQFAHLAADRDMALTKLADDTQDNLAGLRARLAMIGAAAFLALAVGGWLLVGRGLAPLNKLSDAVSQVSEKDFRLPVEKGSLSHELLPIHDRLTHSLNELRKAFEREKQAVADISHELRTPIASLLTTLDVSLRKPRSAEQYKATLEECRDISKQLSRLVERIMTLAWLDAGNDRSKSEEVDAAELGSGCATVIRPLAAAHGLTFSTDLDPEARLVTDPDKLREVVMNLLHNAVEYNRPGGSVALSVGPSNGSVVFEVRDTGIGMMPDVADRIFERFYRADASRTATGVHAGLGLSIVKEYVSRLGGTITVDTAAGAGSTFRVTLPAKVIAPAAPVREAVNVV